MKTKWKTVDTSTLEGLEEANRLKKCGWNIYRSGLFLITFYKKG